MKEFLWHARVYWEDTDGGGIVYHANHLKFLERARTEWLRALGHSQLELLQETGIGFAVASLQIDYRRPARLDDELTISCAIGREGNTSVTFAQRIYRQTPEDLVAEASVRVVCVDLRSMKPRRLPDFLKEIAPT